MPVSNLTQKRVDSAGRKADCYVIHDTKLKGFGLRIQASGRKTYELNITRSGERHRETIGDAATITLKQGRALARNRMVAVEALRHAGPDTPFEVMAELALRRRERLWKPGTLNNRRSVLRTMITPFFIGRPIGEITRRDVGEWFAGLGDRPGVANLSVPLLSVIMREAEAVGARPEGSNPVTGLQRYRRPKIERTLTPAEMARLGTVLNEKRAKQPLRAAMVELIFLTGCRKGEMINLQWRDYRNGHLHLPDSKTGPKTIFLCSHARALLDGLESPRPGPVFPSAQKGARFRIDDFWFAVREDAGLEDVRLHDLRHNYATSAIQLGVNLRVVGKLLGHNKPETTMRYAHLDDATMRDAAVRVGGALSAGIKGEVE